MVRSAGWLVSMLLYVQHSARGPIELPLPRYLDTGALIARTV